jgi:aldose 1-epimerase
VTVSCQLDPQPGYPCSVLISTTWSVSIDGLRAQHSVVNNGATVAPFGVGIHPYLLVDGVPVDELELEFTAQTGLRTDERGLPVEDFAVAGSPADFRTPRRIGETQLDTAFTGGISGARVTAGDRGVELTLSPEFRWLQLFTGDTLPADRRRRSLAVEPMTCPPDAYNSGRHLVTLAPDETWQGEWGLRAVSR